MPSGSVVSLFTREWIEIIFGFSFRFELVVSLFTREWIEIGLPQKQIDEVNRLPLYEGVD